MSSDAANKEEVRTGLPLFLLLGSLCKLKQRQLARCSMSDLDIQPIKLTEAFGHVEHVDGRRRDCIAPRRIDLG